MKILTIIRALKRIQLLNYILVLVEKINSKVNANSKFTLSIVNTLGIKVHF